MHVQLPSFLFESSEPYFSLPIGTDRFYLVLKSILSLQIAVFFLDLILCIYLWTKFKVTNTTADPQRETRKSKPCYSFSLLTNDYPGRWFLLHAVWNFGITIACIPDVIESLRKPSEACSPSKQYNLMPTLMSMALHLYHVISPWFWKNLTKEDIFHHIVFAIGGLGRFNI